MKTTLQSLRVTSLSCEHQAGRTGRKWKLLNTGIAHPRPQDATSPNAAFCQTVAPCIGVQGSTLWGSGISTQVEVDVLGSLDLCGFACFCPDKLHYLPRVVSGLQLGFVPPLAVSPGYGPESRRHQKASFSGTQRQTHHFAEALRLGATIGSASVPTGS